MSRMKGSTHFSSYAISVGTKLCPASLVQGESEKRLKGDKDSVQPEDKKKERKVAKKET